MASAEAGTTATARRRDAAQALPVYAQPAVLLLTMAMLGSAALLLYLTRNITFLLDEWEFLLYRRGFSAEVLLYPHNEHLHLGPIAIYKLMLELFGMDSARPFHLVSIATFLASAALLFAWLRGRVDQWLALGGVICVLFLGAAWEDLLWAFQIGYFGSMAAGLGMLLALRRGTPRADLAACALLVTSLAFSSLAIPFAIGAAVAIGTAPQWRSRAFVVVIPAALYAVWWIGWGHDAESHVSLHNFANAPLYAFDAIAAALASLLGLVTPRDEAGEIIAYEWGRPLAVLALIGVGWRIRRLGSVPRWLWVVGAIALSFWLLSAINQFPGREPSESRYQYVGGIFVLLIAAELLRGITIRRSALAFAAAVLVFVVLSGISFLSQVTTRSYERTSSLIKAGLAAVEIARDTVDPGFVLEEELVGTTYARVAAGPYLSASDAFGSPAVTEAELAAASEDARTAADRVLAGALGVTVAQTSTAGVLNCETLDPAGAKATTELPPGGAVVGAGPGSDLQLRLRRFAAEIFPIGAGELSGPAAVSIPIPEDASTRPWELQISGRGTASVCPGPQP